MRSGQSAVHGYCDSRVCAWLLGYSVSYCRSPHRPFRFRDRQFAAQHIFSKIFSIFIRVSLHAGLWPRVLLVSQGQGSTREAFTKRTAIQGGASGALGATFLITSGWSHRWEEFKPSDSTKDNERAAEIESGAEVEIVESRDRNQGRAGTENAAGTALAAKA